MAAFVAKVGDKVLTKDGEKSTADILANKKVIGLYFSAHWCPPCRGFTPKLAEFYNSMKDNGQFEVIFLSSDRDQASFDDYYKDMPWIAVAFSERELKDKLSKEYDIKGIPTLVLLDAEGKEITKDGRNDVMKGGPMIKERCQ